MKTLGSYILRTRIHGVLAVSALTLLSVLVSPLSYFISGAPMGLLALRKGARIGLQVACGCLLLMMLAAMTLGAQTGIPVAFMVSVWLPVILCAAILRNTQSQGIAVMCAGAVGGLFIVYINLTLEDIQVWWQDWFAGWREFAPSETAALQLDQVYEFISPLISAFIVSGFVFSLVATLLLARWWQSLLFNPGGFRKEFYSLRLPRALVFPTLLGLLALLLAPAGAPVLIRDMVILMLILYLFQGLSVVHGFVHRKSLSRIWLPALYLSFFILPHAVLLLVSGAGIVSACLGRTQQITDQNE